MRFRSLCHAILAVAALSAPAAFAQTRVDVYAITNARIVTVSGPTIEKGTVVVRNGLIEAVGAGVTPPADARVIDASGLTVYPGFIDAFSNLGVPQSQGAGQNRGGGGGVGAMPAVPQPQQPTSNSNYPTGLQPETNVAEQLRGGDAQFEAARAAGFTTALTVGRDGIFSGQSAVIDLAGESVSGMIVASPYGLHFAFRTVPGQYPGSLLGTFSAFRQMMYDSKRLWAMKKSYEQNPKGMPRPEADRSLEALFPVLEGKMPLVITAVTENEIERSLNLLKEFGVRGVIVGGHGAAPFAARLKEQNIPVIFSLNLPKRATSSSADADPESLSTLRNRAEVPKAVAVLEKAGVRFTFTSGGATNLNDYWTGAAKVVEAGASKEGALRAMTIGAAELLGVSDRTGSIEVGKIANLAVVKGDLLASDKFISHVFVDGRLFEQKERPRERPMNGSGGGQRPAADSSVAGSYRITVEIPGQPLPGTMTFSVQGGVLTGTLETPLGKAEIKNGKATADAFSFAATVDYGGMPIDISASGKVSGGQITGTIDSPQGSIPFSGSRNP